MHYLAGTLGFLVANFDSVSIFNCKEMPVKLQPNKVFGPGNYILYMIFFEEVRGFGCL